VGVLGGRYTEKHTRHNITAILKYYTFTNKTENISTKFSVNISNMSGLLENGMNSVLGNMHSEVTEI
jgi:hypothetical protein